MANASAANSTGQQASPAPRPIQAGVTLDFATLLGVAGGFILITSAMILGGSLGSFIDIPAMLIVLGGTFMVTSISYTLKEVVRAQSVMLRAIAYRQQQPSDAAMQILSLADVARKQGSVLELQKHMQNLRNTPFLHKAISLVVDGIPADDVARILEREVYATMQRHMKSAGILRRAGEVAPAMGLIGTLIGLVQMLGRLEDPSTIGPAMAVALLTTFYGAVLANMVFTPLASKLERNADVEAQVNQIYAMGTASIGRQENPRRLEVALNSILPPSERVRYFD
ncbi:motility protein A [Fodinicurvata halophila]|uniref:Motility protein A n=1 Tax=Fodinicurvata halophila TaxID=1419723 RepID=A0ABV8UJS5_9PROT